MTTVKSSWELKVLVTIAVIASISLAQPILFPLTLSFFLYLLLNPVLEWLVSIKIPKIAGSAMIVGLIFVIISSALTSLVQPASQWLEHAPENLHTIEQKFLFVKKSLTKINKVAETAQDLTQDHKKNEVKVVKESPGLVSYGTSVFDLTSNILMDIFTTLLLLFFLLTYFKPFLQNLECIISNRKKISKENVFLVSLKSEVSNYLFIFSLICVGLGIVMGLSFWLLGLPNPLLWGVMVTLLTFVPYIGHLIGITIILFVSLISFDSYYHIFAPPLIYLIFTILEGQIITPICLGNRLNLNPILILLSILIWGWLWGISGIIISVPLLVTIKIIIEHLPALSKYKTLLE